MEKLVIGPMDPKAFLEKFMPYDSKLPGRGERTIDVSLLPETFGYGQDAEYAFHNAVVQSGLCDGPFRAVDSHNTRYTDPITQRVRRPDFSLFRDDLPIGGDTWANMEMFGDVKRDVDDPFKDLTFNPPHSSDSSRRARGQFIDYARNLFDNTPRTFCFSFVIMETSARLMFFDRGGAAYTESFDWRDPEHSHLSEFLWRFCNLGEVQRGWDTSVQMLESSHPDAMEAKRLIREKENKVALPRPMTPESILPDGVPLYCIKVWDEKKEKTHRVIVHAPQTSTDKFFSRATRGYAGVDLDDTPGDDKAESRSCVVWLKDSWRIDVDGIEKEGDIYRQLNKKGVKTGLPDFRFGGDVPAVFPANTSVDDASDTAEGKKGPIEMQTTKTWAYARDNQTKYWRHIPDDSEAPGTVKSMFIVRQVHHRVVLGKIGRPLRTFDNSKQLFKAIYDAIQCHREAVKAGILHRDISSGNVLMDKSGKGMLIDWELCAYLGQESEARRRERTGTPRFMAVRIMDNLGHLHATRDDLESFVYLAWYHVLRYCSVSSDANSVVSNLRYVFDATKVSNKKVRPSGAGKKSLLAGNTFDDDIENLSPAVRLLLRALCKLFAPLYAKKPQKRDEEEAPDIEWQENVHDEIEQWQRSYRSAENKVSTHDEILRTFERCFHMVDAKWSLDDAANDVYLEAHVAPKLFGDYAPGLSESVLPSHTGTTRPPQPGTTHPLDGLAATSNTTANGKRKTTHEGEHDLPERDQSSTSKRSRRNAGKSSQSSHSAQSRANAPPTGKRTRRQSARPSQTSRRDAGQSDRSSRSARSGTPQSVPPQRTPDTNSHGSRAAR